MNNINEKEKFFKSQCNHFINNSSSIKLFKYRKSKSSTINNHKIYEKSKKINNKNENNIKNRYFELNFYKNKNILYTFAFLRNIIFISLIKYIMTEKLNFKRKLNSENIIYLSIKGIKDYQHIIHNDFIPDPDIVYLNGKEIEIYNGYILINNYILNNVTLIWKEALKSLKLIFSQLNNIIGIDFSNFDSSKVTSMLYMVYFCSELKSINFNNFNTSSVLDMSYMIEGCGLLTSVNLSSFDTSKVTTMDYMFYKCYSLISLNLSSFKTPRLISMSSMFSECKSLKEIDLSNFDTSNVIYMEYLFHYCYSLTSIDISNFDASSVNYMRYMFSECYSLTSLDLSNFNAENVIDIEGMFSESNSLLYIDLSCFNTLSTYYIDDLFYGCTSLISVDLSNIFIYDIEFNYIFANCYSLKYIDFSNAYILPKTAISTFSECSSLTSINLSNFDFYYCEDLTNFFYQCYSLQSIESLNLDKSLVYNMEGMFYGCNSLKDIDLSLWDTGALKIINYLFYDCFSLTYLDLRNFNTQSVTSMKYSFSNCIKLTSINFENFITSSVNDMESMFHECNSLLSLDLSSFDTSRVTNMKSMFFGCTKLASLDLSNFNFESILNMASMFCGCSNLSYINIHNYSEYFEPHVNKIFWDASDYLIVIINNQSNTSLIKNEVTSFQCISYDSFNKFGENRKIIYDTKVCINDCLNSEFNKFEYENFCYKDCPLGTHLLINESNICIKNRIECLENYPYINLLDNSCTDNCFSEDFFKGKCSLNTQNNENKKNHISKIIKEIEKGYMNDLLSEVINENKDLIVDENDLLYRITTSLNQNKNNKEYLNRATLNLGEFENKIKEINNISKNDTLIMLIIEQNVEGLLIPLIKYILFNPITKQQLYLNFSNEKNIIYIYNPVNINENEEYKYNLNSSYYNDICHILSRDGIDITLYERKIEYYRKNMSLCQKNCVYIKYDSINKKSICQCEVLNELLLSFEHNNNILFDDFTFKKSVTNLYVVKCIKVLFSKKGLIKNMGNYIILLIIFIYIISSIIFYIKGYDFLCNQINTLLNYKDSNNKIEINMKKEFQNDELKKNNLSELISNSKKKKRENIKNNLDIQSNLDFSMSIDSINNKKNKENKENKEKFKHKNKSKNNYIDYEINHFSYEEAKEIDKRTFLEYYLSLLKGKHILFFPLNRNKDYNANIIKFCLLLFSLALYFVVNALFFNDSLMYIIYIDKGKYNLAYNIPIIIYSTIISSIIFRLIKILSLSHNNILEVKHAANQYNLEAKSLTVIKCLIIKYICFFIISIVILSLFWFYLSSFCAVYQDTQIYLMKNTLISYLLSIIYTFIICFLPSIFRICALKGPGKLLYDIGQIIQLF